jgi:multicomponent K+:H+ antiporter subunit D
MSTARRSAHDGSADHLLVAPVLLPLATAALMLLLGEGRRS